MYYLLYWTYTNPNCYDKHKAISLDQKMQAEIPGLGLCTSIFIKTKEVIIKPLQKQEQKLAGKLKLNH